jgi:2-keto-4-pentenoate hydratase/2-oxohepta-3-ene-1,7-dioic acid hydratase in catechol pathway
MKRSAFAVLCAGLLSASMGLGAQASAPFKLGTFQLQGRTFLGVVVRDTQVIDFAAADSVIGRGRVAAPADMKQLIERYDAGVRDRIYAVVKAVTSSQGGARPAYAHDLSSLKTLPPIMYPMTMLNAAVNYREHGEEMDRRAGQPQSAGAPPPGAALPGTKSAPGCVGSRGSRRQPVRVGLADRQVARHVCADGPFITPKKFVTNPQNLPVKFSLNGKLMQDATTALMIRDVFELVSYGSNIMTLRSGDVVATGNPSGVGSARQPPVYLKPGDRTVCTYEGVGTLTNRVEAAS